MLDLSCAPGPPLDDFVDRLWMFGDVPPHARERILPSGTFGLVVNDLDARIQALAQAGVRFRNTVEVGPGGKQVQIDDPDGNPIELHEAPQRAAK